MLEVGYLSDIHILTPLESKYILYIALDENPPSDVAIIQSQSCSLVRSNSPPKLGCLDWLVILHDLTQS